MEISNKDILKLAIIAKEAMDCCKGEGIWDGYFKPHVPYFGADIDDENKRREFVNDVIKYFGFEGEKLS